ncbi:hypothetical protein BOTNAR_0011g00100 [Botryotinia narcissicola]|uniref:Uncharacterized protein n=1 Tax=Botryotinia narcissicola TaxID=278944 RepID=A0A4Z1J6P1_9HELO|nr:hypothetical protein BOTNAR_0011g00100 [Botryotinia narcissicola]
MERAVQAYEGMFEEEKETLSNAIQSITRETDAIRIGKLPAKGIKSCRKRIQNETAAMIETIDGYLGSDPPEDPNVIEHPAEEWKLAKKIIELLELPEAQQQSTDFKAKLTHLMQKLIDILPATPEIDCDGEIWSYGESVTDDPYTDEVLVNEHVPSQAEAALIERSALASQKSAYTISKDTSTELDWSGKPSFSDRYPRTDEEKLRKMTQEMLSLIHGTGGESDDGDVYNEALDGSHRQTCINRRGLCDGKRTMDVDSTDRKLAENEGLDGVKLQTGFQQDGSSSSVKDDDRDMEDFIDKTHSENSSKEAGFGKNSTLGHSRRTEFQNHTKERRIGGRASENQADWDDALMGKE